MTAPNELTAWKDRFEAVVAAAGQVFYEWSPASNELLLRGPVGAVFGWEPDRVPKTLEEWIEVVHPDDHERFQAECIHAKREKRAFRLDYRVRHHDGPWIWVEDRGTYLVDASGRGVVIGFTQDITRRVVVEAELRRRNESSRRQQAALVEVSALDLTEFTGALQRVLTVLAETLEIERVSFWSMQTDPESIECDHLYERLQDRWSRGTRLYGKDFPAYFQAMRTGAVIPATDARTDPRTAEFRDGYLVPNGITAMLDVPVWEDGRLVGVVCNERVGDSPREWKLDEQEFAIAVANVVSRLLASRHRKRIEAQLLVADRMASMGVLVAGVAHEINNPLAYLTSNLGFVSSAMRQLGAGAVIDAAELDELRSVLADAVEGANRVRDIVADLKTFSREKEESSLVDVNKPVRSAVRMALGELKNRVTVDLDLVDVPLIAASESRLGQVVLNLLINGVQAMPDRPKAESHIRVSTKWIDGRVVVEVADNGAGIPREIRERIFDPFFTTKDVGQGTGLGLSICHSIVTGIGGEITVESEPGVGSIFRLSFPARVDSADSAVVTGLPRPS